VTYWPEVANKLNESDLSKTVTITARRWIQLWVSFII